ncbi:hypothetical protein BN129_2153 [Cronobacter sakazakii 701]|nr:hypothetical protein BN129_2153 [Cronobacter sakazakii 701]
MRKKAPKGVLFCGVHQTFVLYGIAWIDRVWYLTSNYFDA